MLEKPKEFLSNLRIRSLRTPLVIIVLFIGLFVYFRINGLSRQIQSLNIPLLPSLIDSYLDAQVLPEWGCGTGAFDWIDYYDIQSKGKVSVKLSGRCSPHFHALGSRSLRMEYNGHNLRLKSLGSEVYPLLPYVTGFAQVFTEHAIYTIARQFTDYVPSSRLVYINGKRDDIMISWEDRLFNTVREEDNVEWRDLALAQRYAPDRQERFFTSVWKTRNKSIKDLKGEFIKLLQPFLMAVDKDIQSIPDRLNTKFVLPDYLRYLTLNTVFGSSHMDTHNLVFAATQDKEKNVRWHPVLYDLSGLIDMDNSPFVNLNYISGYFFRNPTFVHEYLLELNKMRKQILEPNIISNLFDNYSCGQARRYPNFGKALLQATHMWNIPGDINGYCASVERIRGWAEVRNWYLENQLRLASIHWNYFFDQDRNPYLGMWNPTYVPVKLQAIYCGTVNCTDQWVNVNPPWWQDKERIISAQMVRVSEPGDYSLTKNGIRVIPEPYLYHYVWKGKGEMPSADKLMFIVENAVTGDNLEAVKDPYPRVIVTTQPLINEPYKQKLTVDFLYPMDSEHEPITLDPNGWNVQVISSKCVQTNNLYPVFDFTCSIDPTLWPYPLDYMVSLFYKGAKLSETRGEFFQEYTPPIIGNELNQKTISRYQAGRGVDVLNHPAYLQAVSLTGSRQSLVDKLVKERPKAYILPAGQRFEVTEDLVLDNAVLLLEPGVELRIWPLAKITTDVVIAAGTSVRPVVFSNKEDLPAWFGMWIKAGGVVAFANISGTVNDKQGAVSGENLVFLGVYDSHFSKNLDNISCDNCMLEVINTDFSGGKTGVTMSDSYAVMSGITCRDYLDNCYRLLETKARIEGGQIENIRGTVVLAEGPFTEVAIKGTVVKNASTFVVKKLHPNVTVDPTVQLTDVRLESVDLDDEQLYDALRKQTPEKFAKEYKSFVKRDKSDPTLFTFRNNPPVMTEDILIPAGVTVRIPAGTVIRFKPAVSMVSYGSIIAKGTSDKQIRFTTEKDDKEPWGVVLLRGTESSGVFEYTVFEKGGSAYLMGQEYTGSLTAHMAKELTVTNSIFRMNTGDDSLNCKNTICNISKSLFQKNSFDAIDFDFAKPGSLIFSNQFEDNGNDSIDVSSDNSKIYGNTVNKSGDKCVSVGESSHIYIFDNVFEGCDIGIQSKDGSTAVSVNNVFKNNRMALHAYLKKRRFVSGGILTDINSTMEQNKAVSDHDSDSSVILLTIPTNELIRRYPQINVSR
ncbi:MAG: right-handed parallel beta-helix repeat-containing protein [bacterium]